MSENDEVGHVPNVVEKLKKINWFLLLLFSSPFVVLAIDSFNMSSVAVDGIYDSYEDARNAAAIEAGHQAGYNWTEENISAFESIYQEDGLFKEEITYAEVQCANGMQESCDYVNLEYEVDDSSWSRDAVSGIKIFFIGSLLLVAIFILDLLLIGCVLAAIIFFMS